MRRGDVVVAVAPGEYGKPRPAVVVQSDLFNENPTSVAVCPMTSHLSSVAFRPLVKPDTANGIKVASHAMVDRIWSAHPSRIGKSIGSLSKEDMAHLDEMLLLLLDLSSR